MSRKAWTFVVVRDGMDRIQQLEVSTRALRALSGGAVVAGVVVVAAALVLALDGVSWLQVRALEAENRELAAELDELQGRIASLDGVLTGVAADNARFRSLAGLDPISPEVLLAGVGGPGLVTPESWPEEGAADRATGQSVFMASYDLGALERRAHLLSASLVEATDTVRAHHERFASTPSIRPTSGWTTSGFSQARMHPIHHRLLPHEGVDIAAPEGTPILAAAKGRVIRAQWLVGYGLTVEIDHGFGFTTLYGHASTLIAEVGQEVDRGDVIARVGNTGVSSSPHLHYEVRVDSKPDDPARYFLPAAITS